ncbi:TetR family transcriptional regulator [Tumebacillus sp. BK434]|uniref:TetR/AcrR family transcriptional regulator n=1 Tax=Tumebacillus sp. BK434 TaxID=2512169 RepID=UPI001047BC28|nr:TetR/AcrR family transcriptional regulator [Tumebacillus sp. BK434]TCP57896.1 TetR family transcriptional regulator [Tumebacillus sp. BK434]
MNKNSLRIIKREATAQALANAAFELALERGLDGFVVEDVVQRAGYSRRTFANHYSCKEEAVVMAVETTHDDEEVRVLLDELPDSASPLEVLHHLMKMRLTAEYLRKLRVLVTLSKEYPTLEPYILSVFHRLQRLAQQALSDLFRGRYPEEYTHLLAGAVCGAFFPLLDSLEVRLPGQSLAEAPEAMAFDQYVDTVFRHLQNGF